jgi:hypothetical protein
MQKAIAERDEKRELERRASETGRLAGEVDFVDD